MQRPGAHHTGRHLNPRDCLKQHVSCMMNPKLRLALRSTGVRLQSWWRPVVTESHQKCSSSSSSSSCGELEGIVQIASHSFPRFRKNMILYPP